VATALASDEVVVRVECNEYAATTPYAACQSLLHQVLGLSEATPTELVRSRLESRLAANRPDLLPWLPLLGIPLGLDLPDTQATRDLDDEFRQDRLEAVTVELLTCALPTPTVLVIDDTQVMDAASARVLQRLARELTTAPWLLVVGRRDFPSGFQAPEGPLLQQLRLQPLQEEAAVRLVRATTTGRPLPPDAVHALAEQCGGNPMFLQSLVAAAGRSGSVAELPDSVEGVIGMLLDRLGIEDRLVVRRAAVLGRSFLRRRLVELLDGTGLTLDDERLARLADFLEVEERDRLRFRHALLREVAYQGLPYRQRTGLHAYVGEAIEADGDTTDSTELLSLHFFHAARFAKAWTYSRAAGHRARARYANREAVDFYQRAVDCARRRDSGVDPAALGEVLEVLAEALTSMGLLEEAGTAYQRALRGCPDDPLLRGRIIARQARIDQRLRRFRSSIARLARGIAALRASVDPAAAAVRAVLQLNYGICRLGQGDARDALTWARAAVTEATTSGDREAIALAHATMDGILVTVQQEDDVPHGELALQAYRELDDPTGQAHCLNNIALDAFQRYRWSDAAEGYRQAQELFHRTGDVANEGNAMFNRAELLVRQGHHPAELLEQALLTAQAVADDELEALVLREIARSAGRAGRAEEAARLAQSARELFGALGEDDEVPGCDLVVAEALFCAGRDDEALAATEAVGGPGAGPGAGPGSLTGTWHRVRGSALLGLAREREAEVEFGRGLEAAQAAADRYEEGLNRLGLGLARGDEEAAALGRSADADLRELGVVALPIGDVEQVTHHQGPRRAWRGKDNFVG
jgi:tetratricopeptide (TPR) repeat protein